MPHNSAFYGVKAIKNTLRTRFLPSPKTAMLLLSFFGRMGFINIVLGSDHPIIRSTLRLILEHEPEFRVVAEAANGQEAVVLAEYKRPHVILLDVKLPHLSGIAAARQITSKSQDAGIVFLTEHIDEEYVSEAFKAGARGYVRADSAQNDLIRAIRVVAGGGTFLSPSITSQLLGEYARKQRAANDPIPEHAVEMLCLLAAGYDEQEIARHLNTTGDLVRSGCESVKSMLLHDGVPELVRYSVQKLVVQ